MLSSGAAQHPKFEELRLTARLIMSSVERWPPWLFRVVSLAIVVVVGVVDYATGHEILLSSFYLAAVAFAVWTAGRGFALFIAILSVVAWLLGDFAAGAVYPRALVPAWNAAIIFVFYLVVIALLARLHDLHSDLERRVKARTLALTEEIAERERLEREILDVGERERRRVGRDLHDSLGQLLTGTALVGQVLEDKLASASAPEAHDAGKLVGLVEEAVELTRRLARGLDPVEMDGGGLSQGLRELAQATHQLGTVRCEFRPSGELSVRDSVTATHLYRIAQEAVTNAIKHGRARCIKIGLEEEGENIRMTVCDDGAGLPEADRRGNGMGLRVMSHRAKVLGGTLDVRSRNGGGTAVICEVPNP